MKILLVGSGGREHALAKALTQDPTLKALHCAPGNPGIGKFAQLHNVATEDINGIATLAKELQVDLVVVGPEAPLVHGLADLLHEMAIPCFGPSTAAAQLEGSKDFAKKIMKEAGVPTAESITCNTQAEIEKALNYFGAPYVVKHDGLASGKGVVVTENRDLALAHALEAKQVVIEEYLDGPEISLFGISDGVHVMSMQPAQDFKRAFDNDEGPNTGGMGAYSPLPWAPVTIESETLNKVLQPTIDLMYKRGTPFVGLLYAGLALTKSGIKVIEFNARFGDPETQVLLPRLKTPLAQLLYAAATGSLASYKNLEWSDESAVTVVLASEGYPHSPKVGSEIHLPQNFIGSEIYLAGVTADVNSLRANGGRVLAVTGMGDSLETARANAYRTIADISLPGSFYRRDIAQKAAAVEKRG